MADGVGVYQVTGSVEQAIMCQAKIASSASVGEANGLNEDKFNEKQQYVAYLTGNCPPSWTQYYIGKRHAFVITPMSSSHDEVIMWNTYISGS